MKKGGFCCSCNALFARNDKSSVFSIRPYFLLPIIRGKVDKESAIYTDLFLSYDDLVDAGCKKHYRVKHGQNEVAKRSNHINGIEIFGDW